MTTRNLESLWDLIKPETIQGFIDNLPVPERQLGEFMPERTVEDNEFYAVNTQLDRERAVGNRAWDTALPLGERQGVTRKAYQLAPLGRKKVMTEEQRLKQRATDSGNWKPYVDQIYDDIENLVDGVRARWELQRGQILSTGTLSITDDYGVLMETVDFGVPGGNFQTAPTLWSDLDDSDIITDLTNWNAAFRTTNKGLGIGEFLVSEQVAGYIVRNNALRASLYYGAPNTGPSVVTRDQANAFLEANGLPKFRVITQQERNEAGTYVDVLPANKIIALPAQSKKVGETVIGLTATGLDMVAAGTRKVGAGAGIVGLTKVEDDPPRRINMIDACGNPILANPSYLFVGTVAP